MKRQVTSALREEIQRYIKNGLDISPLIREYSVKGENLAGAIIKDFDRPDEDISGVILSNAIIGEDGKKTILNRVTAIGCNLKNSIWKGEVWARKADCRYTKFTEAFMPYCDYRYADLRYCDFCGTVFQIGTAKALGARFSEDFFKDLAKFWGVTIIVDQEKKINE